MTRDDDEQDRRFLQRAIALSHAQVLAVQGGPFGAVIVRDGLIIAEGCNEVTSANDPTAHAEVVAIRRACQTVGNFSLAGATIYASCEPCPMCLAAIYWARLERLVFANTRSEAAAIGFIDADYAAAGAKVVDNAADAYRGELIVKVKEIQPGEFDLLRRNQILFTYLHLAPDRAQTEDLIASGVTAIAYETVTSSQGTLPLLTPMSEVAGRMAPHVGARCLEKDPR